MPENQETGFEESPPVEATSHSDAQLHAEIHAAEVDAAKSAKKETFDRTTVIAFGLLFVLPAVIIVLSLIFLFPLVAQTLNHQDASGATTLRSNGGAN